MISGSGHILPQINTLFPCHPSAGFNLVRSEAYAQRH